MTHQSTHVTDRTAAVGTPLPVIEIPDVLRALKLKLQPESANRTFRVSHTNHVDDTISFDSNNAVVFEFPTLKDKFPDLYESPVYRLFFTAALHSEATFTYGLQSRLRQFQRSRNMDKLVLWSQAQVAPEVRNHLKDQGIDIIEQQLPSPNELGEKTIHTFTPVPGRPIEYSLIVNHVAEGLAKRLRQLFHLILSEIAAPVYDSQYGRDKFATSSIMRFEEEHMRRLIEQCRAEGRTGIAVDIGCGTGRHSLLLAEAFDRVYAFDLSPRMVQVAQSKKKASGDERIVFSVHDFEYERIEDEDSFHGKCDLVIASFGMGSFVEDTPKMLRRISDWLKPGGKVLLSFYNEKSLVLQVTPSWRETSLAANINAANQTLRVKLPGGIEFDIFCKPFNEGTRGEINKTFHLDRVLTYPTIMSLLPSDLLQDRLTQSLFGEVDRFLSDDDRYRLGHYVLVLASKPESDVGASARIAEMLQPLPPNSYAVLEHAPVFSVEDAQHELAALGETPPIGSLVKTLVFKDIKEGRYLLVAMPREKRLDRRRFAEILRVGSNRIKFASQRELGKLGFPVGGVAPFGASENAPVDLFVDASLKEARPGWLYTGMGDNRKTLRIAHEAFLSLMQDAQWIGL